MSLVNKMLRDLDARRVGNGDRAAFPGAVTPLAARQEPKWAGSWLWFGMVLLAAVLGATAWYALHNPEAPAAPPMAAAPPPAVPAPAAPATAAVTAAAEPAETVASAPAANPAPPSLRMAGELSMPPKAPAETSRKPAIAAPKTSQRQIAAAVQSALAIAAAPRLPAAPTEARIDKQTRLPLAAERAEIAYRRGVLAQRQGNPEGAAGNYRAALEDQPEHAAARQALAGLLIEAKHYDEAEELLRQGAELAPVRLASTLAWARLKVERNQAPAALELLLQNAESGERSAEYQGFAGALLNRAGRAADAVGRYQAATRLAPNEGRWWAGLGMALDAAGQGAEAREAYLKARNLPGLPADLAQHIEQRLR